MTAPTPERARAAPQLLWLLWAPPLALVALRWVLDWQAERHPSLPVWRLQPFVGTQDPWGWVAPLAGGLLALALLALLLRALLRRGQGRWVLLAAWWLLCALGAAAQLLGPLNVRGLQPQAPLQAEIVGRHVQAPSLRSTGGTLLVLRLAGQDGQDAQGALVQLLLDDPAAAALPVHQRLQLQWALGRWQGRYVTAWQPVS